MTPYRLDLTYHGGRPTVSISPPPPAEDEHRLVSAAAVLLECTAPEVVGAVRTGALVVWSTRRGP